MALEVVGAGFGRTGTLSLRAALKRLGFVDCHHMFSVMGSNHQLAIWRGIATGETPDWGRTFEGFRASCDWPSCAYWKPLREEYPEAKVILSVRDSGRWYDSVASTIYPLSMTTRNSFLRFVPRVRAFHDVVFGIVWDGTFGGRFEDRDLAIRTFEDHNASVIAGVPADQLLVFEAKDGWEPLCAFLGVPVPDEPYPHLNDGNEMQRTVRRIRFARWAVPIGAVALVAALIGWLF